MKHEKATTGDVILSLILPGWGVLVGIIALAKKEVRRGLTMIGLSITLVLIMAVLRA